MGPAAARVKKKWRNPRRKQRELDAASSGSRLWLRLNCCVKTSGGFPNWSQRASEQKQTFRSFPLKRKEPPPSVRPSLPPLADFGVQPFVLSPR